MGFINVARNPRGRSKGDIVAALDLGTSKLICLIGRIDEGGLPRLIGVGHQASAGFRNGSIIDMAAAEGAIAITVQAAEEMAGETIEVLIVNVAGGHPASRTVAIELDIAGHPITEFHLRRLHRRHDGPGIEEDGSLVHRIPLGYRIDNTDGIRNPRGMVAGRLAAETHLVTATTSALRNQRAALSHCHLRTGRQVVPSIAAGLATLVEDERQIGATLIDLGGGTTNIAVFKDNRPIYCDMIPAGGAHVTNDIAIGLQTPLACAERLKTLQGSVLISASDDTSLVDVIPCGEETGGSPNRVPRSDLNGIIRPRLEELLELSRDRLQAAGFFNDSGRVVVLTGGTSQLHGVPELAQQIFNRRCRQGRPLRLAGSGEAQAGTTFSTAIGLLLHAAGEAAGFDAPPDEDMQPAGLLDRLGGWFRGT